MLIPTRKLGLYSYHTTVMNVSGVRIIGLGAPKVLQTLCCRVEVKSLHSVSAKLLRVITFKGEYVFSGDGGVFIRGWDSDIREGASTPGPSTLRKGIHLFPGGGQGAGQDKRCYTMFTLAYAGFPL